MSFKEVSIEWKENRAEVLRKMRELTEDLDKIFKNVNIAKITGSSVSIVGSTFVLAGMLSVPFTFGTSLLLTIGGTFVSVLGALTNMGSDLSERLIANYKFNQAKVLLDKDKRLMEKLISKVEKYYETFEKNNEQCSQFTTALKSSVGNAFRVVNFVNKITKPSTAAAAATTTRTTSAKQLTLHASSSTATVKALGLGVAIISIALDIYSLIQTSNKLDEKSQSEYSKKLKHLIHELDQNTTEIEIELENIFE